MLDLMRRGTVTVGSVTWEYHGDTDTQNSAVFYITPQPTWVTSNGLPAVQIVEYETSDTYNGSGYCVMQVELAIPDPVVQAVTADVATRFSVSAPQFLMLPVQSGTLVTLTLPDGQGGVTGQQVSGSDFGSNVAVFQAPLTAAQLHNVKAAMAQQGSGPFEVQYSIIVPAQMPAVTATLSFDASTALNYQVGAQEHTHWASSSTWTYDITEQLTQSNAAKVTVDKVDPSLPQSVVDAVTTWGEQIIQDMVTKAVANALALQQGADGTQSFSVSEISSFSETYEQDETILWRLSPQVTLPTFSDLGLTVQQQQSLEVTVDNRQFVAQIVPQCLFQTSPQRAALGVGLQQSDNPLSDVMALQHLDVTITYPTLTSSATRTHTFTDNTPYTWQGDWDDTAQGNYSISYTAVYVDNNQVTGSKNDVDATTYTLGLADIGTLNVLFDASRFFADSQANGIVAAVTVNFSFEIAEEEPFLQSLVLTPGRPKGVFSSVFLTPVTTDYVYTVTYDFVASEHANPYTSDAKSQNGGWVRLDAPDVAQSMNVIVATKLGGLTVAQADVNIYYQNLPDFPPGSSALPKPTQASPIQLSFPTSSKSKKSPQILPVELFANTSAAPVTFNATLLLSDFSQRQAGPYQFTPQTVAFIAFSPVDQTIFLAADPAIVQWENGDLAQIKVSVTAVRYTPTGGTTPTVVNTATPTQAIVQQPGGRAYPVYFVVHNVPYQPDGLEFDWTATYVYNTGQLYATGTQQGSSLSLPATASDKTPPAGNGGS